MSSQLSTSEVEPTTYFFNRREMERLEVYRAAVHARFYTDQCEPLSSLLGSEVVRLLESVRQEQPAAA